MKSPILARRLAGKRRTARVADAVDPAPKQRTSMKVQTNVKGGGGLLGGGIDLAIVVVVDVSLFGGGCKSNGK